MRSQTLNILAKFHGPLDIVISLEATMLTLSRKTFLCESDAKLSGVLKPLRP